MPISVDGALVNPALAEVTPARVPFVGRIWADETAEGCASGQLSDETVQQCSAY